jgi:hypothetical protein
MPLVNVVRVLDGTCTVRTMLLARTLRCIVHCGVADVLMLCSCHTLQIVWSSGGSAAAEAVI